jgi:hypothetical protein
MVHNAALSEFTIPPSQFKSDPADCVLPVGKVGVYLLAGA